VVSLTVAGASWARLAFAKVALLDSTSDQAAAGSEVMTALCAALSSTARPRDDWCRDFDGTVPKGDRSPG
jgi:hypothetical protein